MIGFLFIGIILGLSAGFSPGPLLALVISETLQYGVRSGIKVALSPILTDLPIILITFLALSELAHLQPLLGLISLGGGVFLVLLARQNFRPVAALPADLQTRPKSLSKGVLTNALSPHPYLFWFSVGAPTLNRAITGGWPGGVGFLLGFYSCLVGAKILLAILAGRSRAFLSGPVYRIIMRVLGLLLILLAVILFRDGLRLLQVID